MRWIKFCLSMLPFRAIRLTLAIFIGLMMGGSWHPFSIPDDHVASAIDHQKQIDHPQQELLIEPKDSLKDKHNISKNSSHKSRTNK